MQNAGVENDRPRSRTGEKLQNNRTGGERLFITYNMPDDHVCRLSAVHFLSVMVSLLLERVVCVMNYQEDDGSTTTAG